MWPILTKATTFSSSSSSPPSHSQLPQTDDTQNL
jgi:hypothetical protein